MGSDERQGLRPRGFRRLSFPARLHGLCAGANAQASSPGGTWSIQAILERLIAKILLPEVWMYWRDVSRGGSIFNAHLSENYREEWNPVARDNIMYSAYVQSMALIYIICSMMIVMRCPVR